MIGMLFDRKIDVDPLVQWVLFALIALAASGGVLNNMPALYCQRCGLCYSCHTANFLERGYRNSACLHCCDELCGYDELLQWGWVVMKKSQVVKRSIVVGGHKTSVSLEDEFWAALKKIALTHRVTLSDLVGSIDSQRQHGNLSSAVRLFVLNHYRQRVEVLEIWPATSKMQPGKSTG
jgi:predicted DNA-binding ribbon-helix-helix protein